MKKILLIALIAAPFANAACPSNGWALPPGSQEYRLQQECYMLKELQNPHYNNPMQDPNFSKPRDTRQPLFYNYQ